MNRRSFLTRLGIAAAVPAATALRPGEDGTSPSPQPHGNERGHGGLGTVGQVDHGRNGFHPHGVLTDFDAGEVSRDRSGRTVHEYELTVFPLDIEIAPGIVYPAWTYNGRVPGPTLRVTQGDRVRLRLVNGTEHPHSVHFHGFHPASMDGVPGAGEVPGGGAEEFTYDFIAEPFGTHLYHCHSLPLREHIARGLYGAFIVDPRAARPEAHEMVIVMNAFDTDFDGDNEVYAANTVAFAYQDQPIPLRAGELQRLHVVNMTENDPLNSIHLHATFFNLYRTGTRTEPDEFTDTVSMGMAERHMLEFTYREPGRYMFHAHQTEFSELGWLGEFEVT